MCLGRFGAFLGCVLGHFVLFRGDLNPANGVQPVRAGAVGCVDLGGVLGQPLWPYAALCPPKKGWQRNKRNKDWNKVI